MNNDIAVIAMSVRAPGANIIKQFWENIVQVKENVLLDNKDKINDEIQSRGIVKDLEKFDYKCFGISEIENEILSYKYKKLIEMSWELLAASNKISRQEALPCSVYIANEGDVLSNENQTSGAYFKKYISNGNEFVSTKISHIFNLSGESLDVLSACSSSLIAIELASQSLIFGNCDYAIAGGCNFHIPQNEGYHYCEGMIYSKTGHCRPFSDDGDGTVESNGAGLVLLKRYEDALKDGDYIYAVIKGFAMNNDASDKISYTSPGISGQKQVIENAIQRAQISCDDVVYLETHGTATSVGDAIEYSVLEDTYAKCMTGSGCYLGSLKANIGHTIRASGVLSFIKTVLILNKGIIPGMCNFRKLSPLISNSSGKLKILLESITDQKDFTEKYAGVSSFGIGGTNAHIILKGHKNINVTETEINNPFVYKENLMENVSANDEGNFFERIRAILKKYLLVDNLEDNMDIYDFGMDSMSLLNFVSECEEVTGKRYPLEELVSLSLVNEIINFICN